MKFRWPSFLRCRADFLKLRCERHRWHKGDHVSNRLGWVR
jgi:hypothetical protein